MTTIISPKFYFINNNKYQVETSDLYKYTYKFLKISPDNIYPAEYKWVKHGLQFIYDYTEYGVKYLRFQFDTINDNLKGMFYEYDVNGHVVYCNKF